MIFDYMPFDVYFCGNSPQVECCYNLCDITAACPVCW